MVKQFRRGKTGNFAVSSVKYSEHAEKQHMRARIPLHEGHQPVFEVGSPDAVASSGTILVGEAICLLAACNADVPTEQPQKCHQCIRFLTKNFPCPWLP